MQFINARHSVCVCVRAPSQNPKTRVSKFKKKPQHKLAFKKKKKKSTLYKLAQD